MKRKVESLFVLLGMSFLFMAFWLFEISQFGWEGIDWISTFYLSPYLSILIFSIFVFFQISKINLKLASKISTSYFVILTLIYSGLYFGMQPFYRNEMLFYNFFVAIGFLPVLLQALNYTILRMSKIQISNRIILFAFGVSALSIPVGFLLNFLLFSNEYGTLSFAYYPFENDLIHLIKTGSVSVMLTIGLGIPLVWSSAKLSNRH